MRRLITLCALLLALPAVAVAQLAQTPGATGVQHVVCDSGCTGGGGGGGSVTQGTVPWSISFASPQAVTQSGAWSISFASPQAVTQSGAWSISFSAPQHVIIDSASLGTVTTTNANIDLAITGLRDAITAASPNNKTLNDLYTLLSTLDTDLKANIVLKTGSTTAVTQATGTNLHMVADSGSTTAVTGNVTAIQGTGSNLHVAVDSAPSTAVTNTGTFAVQAAIADAADVTLGAKADAKSTATDTTPVSVVSVLKEISALEQAPASRAVTNAGTFAVQAAQSTAANLNMTEANSAAIKTDVDKIPSLGQALAASSVPVVLTSIQQTALTPPAAITGFALEAGHAATIDTSTSASKTDLDTISAAIVAQEATTSGVKGLTAFGAVTTNAPTYTTAKSDALSLDTSGLLRASLKDTPSNTNNLNVNLAASAATVTVTGTVTTTPPSNASTNIAQFGGSTVTIGQQAASASLPVILPSATITTLTPPAAITGFALESSQLTGNSSLSAINTNTAPLGVSSAGGYVRQDSTATIAKESGGNLATVATNSAFIAKPSSCGVTPYDSGSLDVPSFIPTSIVASTTCLQTVNVFNATRTAVRFVLTDQQTAARVYFNDWIGPGQALTIPLGSAQFANGVKWNASSPGLNAQARGYQ